MSGQLPESSDIAGFCAMLFMRLGGSFAIGSNGVRYAGKPEPILFRLQGEGLPQLPDAKPHECFHSDAEWQGAIKLVDYCLSRLCKADRDFVYGALASVSVDDRHSFDFREWLQ